MGVAVSLYAIGAICLANLRPGLGLAIAILCWFKGTIALAYGIVILRLVYSKAMTTYGEMLELNDRREKGLISNHDFLKRFPTTTGTE
jgi:hypothetical protein